MLFHIPPCKLIAQVPRLLTNTVVTRANYRDLPDIARLLVALGADQIQFAFVHVLGTAEANKSWLVPRLEPAMTHIRAGLDVARKAGIPAMTEAIPYCLMRGYEDCVAERMIPRTKILDAGRVTEDYTEYRLQEGKAKGPECLRCRYYKVCEGPWKEYPAMFGWGEFLAVEKVRGAQSASAR